MAEFHTFKSSSIKFKFKFTFAIYRICNDRDTPKFPAQFVLMFCNSIVFYFALDTLKYKHVDPGAVDGWKEVA